MKLSQSTWSRAFSLVEVTLALGMVTFCLLGLVGLLTLGLTTVKSSRDGDTAINSLVHITHAIKGNQRVSISSATYRAAGGYTDLEWTIDGQPVSTTTGLSASGLPTDTVADHRFVAYIQLTPPATASASGSALISVAWPPEALWDPAISNWKNAQGSVRTWLIFMPNAQ